jgi:stage V sporulation protein D (sporulation-specific penicillin-binding protein)
MTKVLEESINTGVIFVEKLVGNARFAEYFDRFGFGRKTGVELPAELSGDTKNLDDVRRDIQFFTASFGQGVTMTPLQMISSYQVLANGGLLMRPSIMEKYIHADGREELSEPSEVRQVVSKETATLLGDMLENVVENGHGKRAAVPGYRVGGKTGTAQVAKKGEKGYDDGLTIGSFVGYAPIGDPKFVVLSKIDNPKDVVWAESSAAPVFGDVMKFLLFYAKIEPTEEIQNAK